MSMGGLVARLGLDHSGFGAGLRGAGGELAAFANRVRSQAVSLAGLLGAGFGIKTAIEAATEAQQAAGKLDGVLASTGNTTGFASGELRKFAAELQQMTDFEDDATVAAMALLATFRNIGGQTFKDAVVMAQGMATVMGGDLQSNIKTLGKALNDPIEGLAALSKKGVQFTAEQQGMIRSMQEAGNMAGAQGIIMQELGKRFGTAAQEASTPLGRLKNFIDDIAETVGSLFLPTVQVLSTAMGGFADHVSSVQGVMAELGAKLAAVVKFFVDHAAAIGTAIKWIVAYVVAMKAITVAQRAVAAAQVIVLSLSGPAGWAKLAAGAAIAVAAVSGVNSAFSAFGDEIDAATPKYSAPFEGMRQEADEATAATAKLAERVGKLKEDLRGSSLDKQLQEIDALRSAGGLADFEASGLMAEARHKASGSVDKIQELRDEIGKLKGTTDDAAIAFREMLEKGSTRAQAEAVRDLTGELEKLQAQKKAAEEQKREAEKLQHEQEQFRKSLISEVATPGEKFLGRVRELAKAFKEGTIAPELFARGIQKAREDLAGGGEQKTSAKLEGLQAGSKEALSALIAFNKQGQADKDANKKTEEHTRRMKELLAEVNRKLDRQLDAIEEENVFQIPG